MKVLDLRSNKIETEGILNLADAVKTNTVITAFSSTRFSTYCRFLFKTLTKLDLEGNPSDLCKALEQTVHAQHDKV